MKWHLTGGLRVVGAAAPGLALPVLPTAVTFLPRGLLLWSLALAVVVTLACYVFAAFEPDLARWTRGATAWPAMLWPHLPLLLLLLAAAASTAHFTVTTTRALIDDRLGWLGLLAGTVALLFLAARFLSARNFHCVLTLLLLSELAGIVGWSGGVGGFVGDIKVVVASVGVGAFVPLLVLALFAALTCYRQLALVNARYRPRTIRVGTFRGDNDTRREDLERLLEEGFYKAAFHTPSPFPGGQPHYWRRLMEEMQGGQDRVSTTLRSIGALFHVTAVPHSLDVEGAIVRSPPHDVGGKQGVRVRVTDSRTGELVLSDSFWGRSVHEAVELASYGIVASAFFRCPYLPTWVLWERKEAKVLRAYWRGCDALRGTEPEALPRAMACFRSAASQSPGTAYATFQLAGLLELHGLRAQVTLQCDGPACPDMHVVTTTREASDLVRAIELYTELLARHHHLLLAWYRLAAVLSNAAQWVPDRNEEGEDLEQERAAVQQRVFHALSGLESTFPRLNLDPWGPAQMLLAAEMRRQALQTAIDILRWLARAVNVDVLGWSALSLAERRWFWMTLLYPAHERLALQRSLVATRYCVELQLHLPENQLPEPKGVCLCAAEAVRTLGAVLADHQRVIKHRRGLSPTKLRSAWRRTAWGHLAGTVLRDCSRLPCHQQSHPEAVRQVIALAGRMAGLEREVGRVSRLRSEWSGSALYALACFYAQALALTRRTSPRTCCTSSAEQEPQPSPGSPPEDYWAQRAMWALRRSARDAKGPLGGDRRRWISFDPDLEVLRQNHRFRAWREIYESPPGEPEIACSTAPAPPRATPPTPGGTIAQPRPPAHAVPSSPTLQ